MRRLSRLGLALVVVPGLVATAAPARAADRVEPLSVAGLRCEYQSNPLGIDAAKPRLSWRLRSGARGAVQAAYQVQVAADLASLRAGRTLWDSGRVASDRQLWVPYAGPALESSRRYHWRVRAWGGDGKASAWSAPAWWETGLMAAGDWKARWIQAAGEEDQRRRSRRSCCVARSGSRPRRAPRAST